MGETPTSSASKPHNLLGFGKAFKSGSLFSFQSGFDAVKTFATTF